MIHYRTLEEESHSLKSLKCGAIIRVNFRGVDFRPYSLYSLVLKPFKYQRWCHPQEQLHVQLFAMAQNRAELLLFCEIVSCCLCSGDEE